MRAIETLLAPTDFSPASLRAVHRAARLARAWNATLILLHAVPPPRFWQSLNRRWSQFDDEVAAAAETALARLAQDVEKLAGRAPQTRIVAGRGSDAIVHAAMKDDADLVVMGAVGENEGALANPALGGTALKVLAEIRRPVLLARTDPGSEYRNVLAALDATQDAEFVIAWAARLAQSAPLNVFCAMSLPLGRRLQALGVKTATIEAYEADELAAHKARLEALLAKASARGDVTLGVEPENPGRLVLDRAKRAHHDLIAVTRHAKGARTEARSPWEQRDWTRTVEFFAPCDVLSIL